ncbi:VOC family protein [Pararhizobium sp.]|uniref:VOC family protein n=1 Tax=Pararhizobium sp. TaxID=1977563 RepID=UPI00271FD60E|nr:VOC family protein [Pararhizobium sp.]MDO9417227.1 VOC family protein [Pararhizobium sp.]
MSAHGKFIWAELMVKNTDVAGDFYQKVVGWGRREMKMDGMPSYYLFQIGGDTEDCPGIGGMMTFPKHLEGQIPPNWTGYVAVDDVDQSARDYVTHGGSVMRQPEDIPGIGRFAVVADPHGAVLCIMTPAPMENPPEMPSMMALGQVGWHELMAGNGEEAFDFYAKVFGWQKDTAMDMGDMGTYQLFKTKDEDGAIGGMMTKTSDMPVACWGYYFNVPALDAAADTVRAEGGKVINGPMEVPGPAWIVNCIDPEGAYFSLVSTTR